MKYTEIAFILQIIYLSLIRFKRYIVGKCILIRVILNVQ